MADTTDKKDTAGGCGVNVSAPGFSLMQAVKRRFFAMRNGDLAAQMAAGGIRPKINFGLNLPQISEIAEAVLTGTLPDNPHLPDDTERQSLARLLWKNDTTRESRLIAAMLFSPGDLQAAEGAEMLAAVASTEEADILCHRLLRRHRAATEIARAVYSAEASDLQRYAALRLLMNLLVIGKADLEVTSAIVSAETALQTPSTPAWLRALLVQLTDELSFLSE